MTLSRVGVSMTSLSIFLQFNQPRSRSWNTDSLDTVLVLLSLYFESLLPIHGPLLDGNSILAASIQSSVNAFCLNTAIMDSNGISSGRLQICDSMNASATIHWPFQGCSSSVRSWYIQMVRLKKSLNAQGPQLWIECRLYIGALIRQPHQ